MLMTWQEGANSHSWAFRLCEKQGEEQILEVSGSESAPEHQRQPCCHHQWLAVPQQVSARAAKCLHQGMVSEHENAEQCQRPGCATEAGSSQDRVRPVE